MGFKANLNGLTMQLETKPICGASSWQVELLEILPFHSRTGNGGLGEASGGVTNDRCDGMFEGIPDRYFESALSIARDYREYFSLGDRLSFSLVTDIERGADPDFLSWLADMTERAGIPIESLGLQISEADVAHDGSALKVLQRIGAAGFGVSIERAISRGGFEIMASPAVKLIQLDRVFADNWSNSSHSKHFVKGLARLAKSWGKKLAVDGIDCKESLLQVQEMNVPCIKGKLAVLMAEEAGLIW